MSLIVEFILTERCNLKCRHCLHGEATDMQNGRDIPLRAMISYLDQIAVIAARQNTGFVLGFSGGEPMLRLPDLLEACRYARSKGAQKVTTMTNAYWGADEQKARQMVRALKDAGMDTVGVSIDDFHQEFVPLSSVLTVLKLLREYHMAFSIKTVVTKKTRRIAAILGDLGDLLLDRGPTVQEMSCIPTGSAVAAVPPEELLYTQGLPDQACESAMAILPGGDVYPCCGAGFNAGILLGNANTDSLQALYYKMKEGTLYNILRKKGPVYFADALQAAGHSLECQKFVGACDLCQAVFSHPAYPEVASTALKEWRRECMEKVLSGVPRAADTVARA